MVAALRAAGVRARKGGSVLVWSVAVELAGLSSARWLEQRRTRMSQCCHSHSVLLCPPLGTCTGREDLLSATEELIRLSGAGVLPEGVAQGPAAASAAPSPSSQPSPAQVSAWYVMRALALDAAAGQLQGALTLLELGSQRGAGSVEVTRLLAVGRLVSAMVAAWWPGSGTGGTAASAAAAGGPSTATDADGGDEAAASSAAGGREGGGAAAAPPPPAWAVTLGGFVVLSPEGQASLLMASSSEATLQQDLRQRCVAAARMGHVHVVDLCAGRVWGGSAC